MARPRIGIDVGTSAVRAAEVAPGRRPTLVRFAQVALPPGAVADGEIRDRDAVAAGIRDLWRRGGFRAKQVAASVSNQRVVIRQVELPWMEEKDLRSALGFQVQEHIPFAVEDALIDFLQLEEFTAEDGTRMLRLIVVAAVREMIDTVVAAIDAAGLQPAAIDYSGFAALRAVRAAAPEGIPEEPGTEVLLDIGAGVTDIVAAEEGMPRFVRILPTAGSDVTEALVSELNLEPEAGESAKASIGVGAEGATLPLAGPERIIERQASAFIGEVRSSIEYHQAQEGSLPLQRVLLVGGGARLPGLTARLEAALHVPVDEGHPLAGLHIGKLKFSPEQLYQVAAVAAVAVGLALEDGG